MNVVVLTSMTKIHNVNFSTVVCFPIGIFLKDRNIEVDCPYKILIAYLGSKTHKGLVSREIPIWKLYD